MTSQQFKYPNTTSPAVLMRDFSKGRMTKYSANSALIPPNSVSNSINVNFDTVIGSGVVRQGTTLLGSIVASGKIPLGMTNFVGPGGTPNVMIAAFSGSSTASLYYYDTAWHTSGATSLDNSAYNRFAQIGGHIFRVNGVNPMSESVDGNTWSTFVDGSSPGSNCLPNPIIPSLIFRTKSRLLAAGYSGITRDRVYFSSIIDPSQTYPAPFITWNTDATSGDWIDINPDDSSNVTAFAETSNQVIVFKTNAMYRMDVINVTVDTQNIFNIGAISQESVATCQGIVYFFSGIDVRRTDGTYPEQISRLGVQDFIDAIPQANWSKVCAGSDGFNVYFSIGTVTLNVNKNLQKTYNNVVLKFSTRDETWSAHSYGQQTRFYANFTTPAGRTMVSSDTTGSVQTINSGWTDNTLPIFFFLETQEEDFGNRAHANGFNDLITIFTKDGIGTSMQVKSDDADYKDIVDTLPNRVNTIGSITFEGHYFMFKWFGSTSTGSPTFEGLQIEKVIDEGLQVTTND